MSKIIFLRKWFRGCQYLYSLWKGVHLVNTFSAPGKKNDLALVFIASRVPPLMDDQIEKEVESEIDNETKMKRNTDSSIIHFKSLSIDDPIEKTNWKTSNLFVKKQRQRPKFNQKLQVIHFLKKRFRKKGNLTKKVDLVFWFIIWMSYQCQVSNPLFQWVPSTSQTKVQFI